MKTFAALALLAVAACAVDVNADASIVNHNKSNNNNAGTDHTVQVDVWSTLDSELMDLMDEVDALIASVALQGQSL